MPHSFLCCRHGEKLKIYDRAGFDLAVQQFGDGEDLELTLGSADARKSRQQEKGFHAMISRWAKDEGHRIDDLKRDLLAEVFGLQEHTDPISGAVVLVLREPHTSALSREQYSELIERTLEIAASCGYPLVAPSEYRAWKQQQVEKAAKRQRRSQTTEAATCQ